MSLTSKQIDELRSYAKDRKGELAKLINDAADTIELLSAKLHASQMERSSQYYHGGWIPCSERLPEEKTDVLIQFRGTMAVGFWENVLEYDDDITWYANSGDGYFTDCNTVDGYDDPIAWMPLPEPYKGD